MTLLGRLRRISKILVKESRTLVVCIDPSVPTQAEQRLTHDLGHRDNPCPAGRCTVGVMLF